MAVSVRDLVAVADQATRLLLVLKTERAGQVVACPEPCGDQAHVICLADRAAQDGFSLDACVRWCVMDVPLVINASTTVTGLAIAPMDSA